ncbi:MAG: tetratricopeptide repeat protein [Vicinamibacteria bacterium]
MAAQPQDATLHNRLGMCYQRAGDANAARAAYRRALELWKDYAAAEQPGDARSRARPVQGRRRLRPRDQARRAGRAVYHKNLGSAWLARGDAGKALEAWTEALRLDSAAFEADAMKVPGPASTSPASATSAKVFARGDVEHAIEYLTKAQAAGFTDWAARARPRLRGRARRPALRGAQAASGGGATGADGSGFVRQALARPGQPARSRSTASAIASDAVRPGESIPASDTKPGRPRGLLDDHEVPRFLARPLELGADAGDVGREVVVAESRQETTSRLGERRPLRLVDGVVEAAVRQVVGVGPGSGAGRRGRGPRGRRG